MGNEKTLQSMLALGIFFLATPNVGGTPVASGWSFFWHQGESGTESYFENADSPICQDVKAYMDRVAPKWMVTPEGSIVNHCSDSARGAPFFTEPPWTELDPRRYQELIFQLMKYEGEGEEYFNSARTTVRHGDDFYRAETMRFLEQGGQLQYWQTTKLGQSQVFSDLTLVADAATPNQHVIQLRYKSGGVPGVVAGSCPHPGWKGNVFLVQEDLHMPLANQNRLMNYSSLLLYKGKPVFVDEDFFEINITDAGTSGTTNYCRLVYPNKLTLKEQAISINRP